MKKKAEVQSAQREASWEEDAKLVRTAGEGDRSSQRQLLERALPTVRKNVAYLVGKSPEFDDIVQMTLLAVLEASNRFRGHSSLSTWVTRITIRTALRHMQRGRRLLPREDIEACLDSIAPQGEHALVSQELWKQVEKLPEPQRVALVLRYGLDFRIDEIAEATETSKNTVKYRLKEALTKLRRHIRPGRQG